MGRPTVTAETFWNRVHKGSAGECWPWFGTTNKAGNSQEPYGRIDAFGFKGVYVHRIAYWLSHGGALSLRKDGDVLIRHNCDNTLCCNPEHLVIGTHADNMRDKVERGRSKWWADSTETPRAKLTEHDVRQIRRKKKDGSTYKELMLFYKVSKSTITGVLSGRHYSDIQYR